MNEFQEENLITASEDTPVQLNEPVAYKNHVPYKTP